MRTFPNILVSLALISSSSLVSADNKSIEGVVIGIDGKPLPGVEVRAEGANVKAATTVALTDVKGQYVLRGLLPAAYTVTASVGGTPRSRANVMTQKNGWVRVDFDLRKAGNTRNTNNSNASA